MSAVGQAATAVALVLLVVALVCAACVQLRAGPRERRAALAATQPRLTVLGTAFALVALLVDPSALLFALPLVAVAALAVTPGELHERAPEPAPASALTPEPAPRPAPEPASASLLTEPTPPEPEPDPAAPGLLWARR